MAWFKKWRSGPDALYLALLGILSVLFFGPLWSLDKVLYQEDISDLMVPVMHWLHTRLSAGLPATWCQGLMGGVPVSDSIGNPSYYPPTHVILKYFDGVPAMLLLLWLHAWWAACGCYALARSQRVSPGASFFAAVLGGFSGGMVFAQRWLIVAAGLAWVPWAILGLVLLQDQQGSRRVAGGGLLGLALAMSYNSGYPGVAVYLAGIIIILHVAWMAGRPGWAQVWSAWKAAASAAVVSVLLVLGPVAATARLASQSMRGEALSLEEAALNSMSPAALGQVFLPEAFGRLRDNSYLGMSWRFGSHQPHGMLLYVGVLGLAMALYAFARRGRAFLPWAVGWAALAVYALGDNTPAFAQLIKLPVLDHLRAPAKAAEFCVFMLIVPVAWGIDDLRNAPKKAWVTGLAVLGAALMAAGLLLILLQAKLLDLGLQHIQTRVLGDSIHHYPAQYYLDKLARWLLVLRGHLLAQGAWAIAAAMGSALVFWRRWPAGLVLGLLLFGELASNGMHYMPRAEANFYRHVPSSVAQVLKREEGSKVPYRAMVWGWNEHFRASFPNGRREGLLREEAAYLELPLRSLPLIYGMDLYNAYFPSILRRHHPLHGWFMDTYSETDMDQQTEELLRRRRFWDLGGAKYVFSERELKAPGLRLLRSGSPRLYENLQALPLAYFADLASGGWDADRAEKALLESTGPVAAARRPALVEGEGPFSNGEGRLSWQAYRDELWDLEVECSAPATLVLSRTFYDGMFEATVDGKKADLWPANVGSCAVAVPAGKHRVRVALKDPLDAWAPWTFAAGLLLALGLMMTPYFKRSDAHG